MKGLGSILVTTVSTGLLAGSAVGVAAQDEKADLMAPSAFTGEFTGPLEHSTDPATGLEVSVSPWEATDPRASGTWTQVGNEADLGGDDWRRFAVGRGAVRLVNDGGSWVGTRQTFQAVRSEWPPSIGIYTVLAGEGGYEGLSMYIFGAFGPGGIVSNGFIVPTEMVPAMPPPPAAEQ